MSIRRLLECDIQSIRCFNSFDVQSTASYCIKLVQKIDRHEKKLYVFQILFLKKFLNWLNSNLLDGKIHGFTIACTTKNYFRQNVVYPTCWVYSVEAPLGVPTAWIFYRNTAYKVWHDLWRLRLKHSFSASNFKAKIALVYKWKALSCTYVKKCSDWITYMYISDRVFTAHK